MEVSVHIVSRTAVAQAQLIYYMPTIGWHVLNFPQKVHALIRRSHSDTYTKTSQRGTSLCQGHWKFQNIRGHRCVQGEMLGKRIWAKYLQTLYDWFGVVKRDSYTGICCHLKVCSICQGWNSYKAYCSTSHLLNDQLWRKINGTIRGFPSACGFCELQTFLKNEKKKLKEIGYQSWAGRGVLTHIQY